MITMTSEQINFGEGRLVNRSVAYGDESAPLRVWIADGPRDIRYYYVSSVAQAIDVIDEYGYGADAAGLEERDNSEWIEWYDDRGCDIDDLIDERDDDPDTWAATWSVKGITD